MKRCFLSVSVYSPDFAPIELLFNTLKMKTFYPRKRMNMKLKKDKGLRAIKECLGTID